MVMTMVKNIFFDFDGTLMDTWTGIETTINASLQALDIIVPDDAVTRDLVGIPLLRVFEVLLDGDTVRAGIASQKYRELFPTVGMPGARPFDGVPGMLDGLKVGGREVFLVTARNEIITKQMLKNHGLNRFFTWVRGEQEGEVPGGKERMVAEVLERFDLDPGNCVMVGDRRYDVEAARANGVQAIGVTYGYGTKEELMDAGAGALAGSIAELEEILVMGNSS
jgi:phosphoglycolate phosphatase